MKFSLHLILLTNMVGITIMYIQFIPSKNIYIDTYISIKDINTHFNLLLQGMAVHQVHVASGLNPTNCHHTGTGAGGCVLVPVLLLVLVLVCLNPTNCHHTGTVSGTGIDPTNCHHTGDSPRDKARIMSQ